MNGGPAAAPRPLWARLLKPLLVVAVLAFVGTLLPWEDRLTFEAPVGTTWSVEGTIEGDWKADAIAFAPAPGVALPQDWPGGPLGVQRQVAGEAPEVAAEQGGAVLAADGVGFLARKAKWDPSMGRVFGTAELSGVVLAMGLFFIAVLFGVTRWWRLLALVGCRTTWWNVLRLTYLGLFFNLVMPGLTGGDVAKAVIVVREHPERRGSALMSVVVDRLIGLFTLAVLALVVILLSGDTFAELRLPMVGLLGAGLFAAFVYFHPGMRRALRFDRIIARLPMGAKFAKLDEAARLYVSHPVELAVAMLLSLGNHVGAILAVWALGTSFGVPADLVGVVDYFAMVPVANIVSSVPILPGGWGVGEMVYMFLFELIGASATFGVAVSVSFRLCQLLLSLLGGLFLLAPGARAELGELEGVGADGGAEPFSS